MRVWARRWKWWTWGTALLLVLAGCSGGGGTTAEGSSPSGDGAKSGGEKPSNLILATGGTAGTYYPLGGGMANLLKDKANLNTTAQVTGASVENMRLIKNKEADLAITQSDIADYAAKGSEMFTEGPVGNLRAIGGLYNETIQIVVPAKSSIKTVADLKGKRVSVGAPGSGTEANARQILEIYGLTFKDMDAQRLSFGDSAKKIQDGGLDAAFITAGAPTAAVNELAATTGVNIISMEKDKVGALIKKYPFYAGQTIPAATYPGQSGEIQTVAVKAVLTARAELDPDMVYRITKTLFENTKSLEAINAKAKEMKADTALDGLSIKLHPGAEKYFKEKGILK